MLCSSLTGVGDWFSDAMAVGVALLAGSWKERIFFWFFNRTVVFEA